MLPSFLFMSFIMFVYEEVDRKKIIRNLQSSLYLNLIDAKQEIQKELRKAL